MRQRGGNAKKRRRNAPKREIEQEVHAWPRPGGKQFFPVTERGRLHLDITKAEPHRLHPYMHQPQHDRMPRLMQQQRTDVLAVGALAVFIVRAVAGRADKAAVLPQPCLRVVIAAALALHHGRKVAHAVLVDGAGALLDALAVLFGPLKNILAQKRADLVCIHGCSLPVWL